MKEYLIQRGGSHILVDMARMEAFSFNQFGESRCKVNAAEAYYNAEIGVRGINILSLVGKFNYCDIYYKGKRVLVQKSVLTCRNLLKTLKMVSPIPYRITEFGGVQHILFAVDPDVFRKEINSKLNIQESDWELL